MREAAKQARQGRRTQKYLDGRTGNRTRFPPMIPPSASGFFPSAISSTSGASSTSCPLSNLRCSPLRAGPHEPLRLRSRGCQKRATAVLARASNEVGDVDNSGDRAQPRKAPTGAPISRGPCLLRRRRSGCDRSSAACSRILEQDLAFFSSAASRSHGGHGKRCASQDRYFTRDGPEAQAVPRGSA